MTHRDERRMFRCMLCGRVFTAIFVLGTCCAPVACSSKSEEPSGGGGGAAIVPDCGAEPFTAGIQKSGDQGKLDIAIESSDPAPPAQGNDTWVLKVTDSGGAPISDATIAIVPFMPLHNHGSSVKATITSLGDGRYKAVNVNFPMPGKWEITIEVTLKDGTSDKAVFTFCIAD